MSTTKSTITSVPGPWKLKGDAHVFFTYTTNNNIQALDNSVLYEVTEADDKFSRGKLVGGLAAVYVIRYHESPVGPYDELILIPGSFESEQRVKGSDGKIKTTTQRKLRISRIYVSTKETCYNGRRNWNIPKHIARFEFKTLAGGMSSVVVYPEDPQSKIPLFRATFKPFPYLPAIPASTGLAKFIGLDFTHIQPPLPSGDSEELAGTDEWCSFLPLVSSSKTSLEWWDMKQVVSENDPLLEPARCDNGDIVHENWLPGLSRWKLGIKMENAEIDFPVGDHWRND